MKRSKFSSWPIKVVKGWSTSWEEAKQAGLSLERAASGVQDPTAAPEQLGRGYQESRARVFPVVDCRRVRDSEHTLKQDLGSSSDWIWGETFSPIRTIQQWNRGPVKLCNLHPWGVSRPDWIKPSATLSNHIVDLVLSRACWGPVQPELFYDALTTMEAGTDCGPLYFVDPVRQDLLTSASSQTENDDKLLLDVCIPVEHHMHSSTL